MAGAGERNDARGSGQQAMARRGCIAQHGQRAMARWRSTDALPGAPANILADPPRTQKRRRPHTGRRLITQKLCGDRARRNLAAGGQVQPRNPPTERDLAARQPTAISRPR